MRQVRAHLFRCTPEQTPPRLPGRCSPSPLPVAYAATSLGDDTFSLWPRTSARQAGSLWLLSHSNNAESEKGTKALLQKFLEMSKNSFFLLPGLLFGHFLKRSSGLETNHPFHPFTLTKFGSKITLTSMALTICNGLCYWHKDESTQFLSSKHLNNNCLYKYSFANLAALKGN